MNQMTERKRRRREYLKRGGMGVLLAFLCLGLLNEWLFVGIFYLFCLLISAALIISIVAFLGRDILVSRKATQHWREKWPDVQNTEQTCLTLLRAANEPPIAQSDILLRAAQGGQETPKEELLRVAGKE